MHPSIVVVHVVINTYTMMIYRPVPNGFSTRAAVTKKVESVPGALEYESNDLVLVDPIQEQLSRWSYVPVSAFSRPKGDDHWSLIIHFRRKFNETDSQRMRNAVTLMDQLLSDYAFHASTFDNPSNSSRGLYLTEPKFLPEGVQVARKKYPRIQMETLGFFQEVAK